MAVISSIDAVCCSVEALIPSIGLKACLILYIISFILIPEVLTADFDASANLRTSSATTANPLPYSPALPASILAFRANKLVCSAILVMILIIL